MTPQQCTHTRLRIVEDLWNDPMQGIQLDFVIGRSRDPNDALSALRRGPRLVAWFGLRYPALPSDELHRRLLASV